MGIEGGAMSGEVWGGPLHGHRGVGVMEASAMDDTSRRRSTDRKEAATMRTMHVTYFAEVECSPGHHGIALEIGHMTPVQGQFEFNLTDGGRFSMRGEMDVECDTEEGKLPAMRVVTTSGVMSVLSFQISAWLSS